MRAEKLLTSRQIFRYAVPARTVRKKSTAYKTLLYWVVDYLLKVRLDLISVFITFKHLE